MKGEKFKSEKLVKTNFQIISNNRVNVQLLLLLSKIRTLIRSKDKAILTIDLDNSNGELTFEFTVNDNEIESIRIDDNNFQI